MTKAAKPGQALPDALEWIEPLLKKAETSLAEAPLPPLIQWGLNGVQSFGITSPARAAGGDLDNFARKLRACLLTDGNTRFKPSVRTFLVQVILHGPHQLDHRLILEAAVKSAVPEALSAIGAAYINRIQDAEGAAG